MSFRTSAKHLSVALAFATISSLFATSLSFAQTPGSLAVRVESPSSGALVHGNVTFTGLAVDCASGQPATRVAVHDGANASAPYLADVSMDTSRSLTDACANQSNVARDIGFTLILDSNRLTEGRHMLAFVAHFPRGATQATTIEVNVDNIQPRQTYRYPANYTGIYYGGYYVNGAYTPTYTRCIAWDVVGNCTNYQVVTSPIVTPSVYPGCITNVYGNCVSYPYAYNTYNNAYFVNNYLNNLNGFYYWNGWTWVRR